jgi:arylsulfatase A-like enzyme/Flp pilus assembly protein TadD
MRILRRLPIPGLLLMLSGLVSAADETESISQTSVLLITVDTLRPDALGWVAGLNETPALDQLAGEGFRFPAAISPAPLTLPAHASILTGLEPRRHGARDNGQLLGGDLITLAEVLAEHGYTTAAVISGFPLDAMFGLDRGFSNYDDALPLVSGAWGDRPARAVTKAALDWLGDLGTDTPFFLWVHYYDPHDPYDPPAEFRRSGPRGAYHGEVAAVDAAVAELRRGLTRLGRARNLLTVFCADHGEALGEHDEETHGFFVYDSTILVPLVFHGPTLIRPGRSILPVRLIDVAPTVVELVGIPPLAGIDGTSLTPTLRGRRQKLPPALAETLQPWLGYGWAPLAAVRTGGWKLVDAPRPELFDLRRDPGEVENLAAGQPDRVSELRRSLDGLRTGEAVATGPEIDPSTLDALRALGYAVSAVGAAPPPDLADPKDRLPTKHRLDAAERSLTTGDAGAALAGFRAVLESEPDNRYALLRSAAASDALGRPADGIPPLERLVLLDPSHAEAWYRLADARSRTGRTDAAVAAWREVVRLQPRRAVAWSNLGAMLFESGQPDAAVDALGEAVRLDPADPELIRNLCEVRLAAARAALAADRAEAALALVAAAAATCPDLRPRIAADPHLGKLVP